MRCCKVSRNWVAVAAVARVMSLQHIPARNHISRGEMFPHQSRQRANIQGIDLDQIPGIEAAYCLGFRTA